MPPTAPDIVLVYADAALIVVNKACGQLSVPGRGSDKQDCLSARVQQHYPDACVVHRLDMATSGLLLLARGAGVQRHLNACFANRQVHKRYEAVVTGLLLPGADQDPHAWSSIDLPLRPDWPHRPKSMVDLEQGKPSLTRWRVLAVDKDTQTTRLLLEPVTGRSHQIRVHLQAIGHPIVGDALYAPTPAALTTSRLLLHASELRLHHPIDGQPLQFSSPPPF
jgi:tRNA pseudouridine32 synthase/23S rRNA pseudouridine746 synthase